MVQFASKTASVLVFLATLSSTCNHATGFGRRLKSERVVFDPVQSESTQDGLSSFSSGLFFDQSSSTRKESSLQTKTNGSFFV